MTVHDPALAQAVTRAAPPRQYDMGPHDKLHVLADAIDGVQGLIGHADGGTISDGCMTAILDVFSDQLRAIAATVPKH